MESINTTCTTQLSSVGFAPLLLTQLLTTIVQSYCKLHIEYPPDQTANVRTNDEFDFIVVGAGSAGAAIAGRLSEVPSWRVLLIEAGSDPPVESNIPALFPSLFETKYDWYYRTEKSDVACQAMNNHQCVWPKGKMLGGSSSMNVMYYVRGNKEDYDNWQGAGNTGWSYKDVLKYFKKLEKVKSPRMIPELHGQDGYVSVTHVPETYSYHTEAVENMIREAAEEQGLPYIDDCTSNTRPCITESPFTIDSGMRMSAARAYLASNKDRQNLIVMKEAVATKLLIDEEKRVYGVEVYTNDYKFVKIMSKKEVIVSAGTVASAQLLMLSGIGPKEDLESLDIPVVQDLKVGYNLQDHIFLTNFYASVNLPDDSPPSETDHMYFYLTRKKDSFATPLSPSLLFANLNGAERPNIQFHFWNSPSKNPFMVDYLNSLNFKAEVMEQVVKFNQDHHLVAMYPKLIQPKSRGRVTLSSDNPLARPKITHGYLTEEEDIKLVVEGMKLAFRMMESKALNATRFLVQLPKCAKLDPVSDQFYECYARHFMSTVYHPAGTCKMGPKSDPDAVVDPTLKVYGVSGLRVADSSIMPTIVSGNTNVPTMMIGEKAADMIKKEWLKEAHQEL